MSAGTWKVMTGQEWWKSLYSRAPPEMRADMWKSFRDAYRVFVNRGLREHKDNTLENILPDPNSVFHGERGQNYAYNHRIDFYIVACTGGEFHFDGVVYTKGMAMAFACTHTFSPKVTHRQYAPYVYLAHICAMIPRVGHGAAIVDLIRRLYPAHMIILEVEPSHHELLHHYLKPSMGFMLASDLPAGSPGRALLEAIRERPRLGEVEYSGGYNKIDKIVTRDALSPFPGEERWIKSDNTAWMVSPPRPGALVGQKVRKFFSGYGYYKGEVKAYGQGDLMYSVVYEDGDKEDCTAEELQSILVFDPADLKQPPASEMDAFVQRQVDRGLTPGILLGRVMKYDPAHHVFHVVYDDKTKHIMTLEDLKEYIVKTPGEADAEQASGEKRPAPWSLLPHYRNDGSVSSRTRRGRGGDTEQPPP